MSAGDKNLMILFTTTFSKITGKHLHSHRPPCNYLQELRRYAGSNNPGRQDFTHNDWLWRKHCEHHSFTKLQHSCVSGGALHTLLLEERKRCPVKFVRRKSLCMVKTWNFSIKMGSSLFSCADYANNAELLLSHLFGSIKAPIQVQTVQEEVCWNAQMEYAVFWTEVHRLIRKGRKMLFIS